MILNPLEYPSNELKFIRLNFQIGKVNSTEIIEIIRGKIINISLASNSPHLPTDLEIRFNNYEKRWLNLFELKKFNFSSSIYQ